MLKNQDAANSAARIAELEKSLEETKGVVSILYHALNDASTVVDAGDDEDYAYQAELEAGAECLGIKRDRIVATESQKG